MKVIVIIFAILCAAIVCGEIIAALVEKDNKEDYDNEPNKDERR